MKKFAKIAALILVVVMSVALLVACAPNSDPDKAGDALKKNGYTTTVVKDAALLSAAELLLGCDRGDIVARVKGSTTDADKNFQTVTIYYFRDSAAANKFYDKVKSESDKESKDQSNWIVGKSGAMVYYGTDAAIKAAK